MHPEAAMFERLDPPEPFRPGPAFHDAVVARGRRIRRRRHRIAGVALSSVVVLAGVVGVGAGWSKHQWEHVKRVQTGAAPKHVDALGGAPFNVLVVGLDGPRPDAPDVVGERTDTILVARIQPAAKKVQVVSLPRDLWVAIQATARAASTPRSGWATSSCSSTRSRRRSASPSTATSGSTWPASETWSIRPAGCSCSSPTWRGQGAGPRGAERGLRHPRRNPEPRAGPRPKDLEWLVDGHWHLDLTGDLGRMQRQQTFGRVVLAALGDIGTDPVSQAHLLDLFVDHVAMDSYWTREQLDGVLDLARTLGPDDVSTRTVPVTDAVRGGAQVLLPSPAANDVFASLRGDVSDAYPGAAESGPAGDPSISPC